MTIEIPRALVGRDEELVLLRENIRSGDKVLAVVGPSGIGKTRFIEAFCEDQFVSSWFEQVVFSTIYRTDWTTALSQLKRHLGDVPANVTLTELERAIVELATRTRLLLVFDNVEASNAAAVESFASQWMAATHESTLVLTVQPDVRAVLPAGWPELRIRGLTAEEDVLSLLGDLRTSLPIGELRQVGEMLEGNPLMLLFLRWLAPSSVADLQESAAKLADHDLARAVEGLVDQEGMATLFFLALGVHKDLNVSSDLLAAMWDHFGSRGAEPFVRSLAVLTDRGFLTPTRPGQFRLHESIHVALPKVLQHRIGIHRIPSLHHYFAEFYRRQLYQAPTSLALTHFVYHARLAEDYQLIYDTLIGGRIAETLANLGTTLQVRSELESYEQHLTAGVLLPREMANLYLVLGRLCNALSDHARALDFMRKCEEYSTSAEREVWYINAVAYSNTGQSDACLQNYFKIVNSCDQDADALACLSLGYLAHDLKYRNLETAAHLGFAAVTWARSFDSGMVLAKNLSSYAETVALRSGYSEARLHFEEAEARARSLADRRELGRILTNFGFYEYLAGEDRGLDRIREGTEHSRTLGDRRRHCQGMLYAGVCLARKGGRDMSAGRASISSAAAGFQVLDDGRYFTPAVMWLCQLDGLETDGSATATAAMRPDLRVLYAHLVAHPEFGVYQRFWTTCLAQCLEDRAR